MDVPIISLYGGERHALYLDEELELEVTAISPFSHKRIQEQKQEYESGGINKSAAPVHSSSLDLGEILR